MKLKEEARAARGGRGGGGRSHFVLRGQTSGRYKYGQANGN